jgi:predicted phage terminase large subunit-like protein
LSATGTFVLSALPELLDGFKFCRSWDLAATQGGGDFTSGNLHTMSPHGLEYVVDVSRQQLSSERVRSLILKTAAEDKERYGHVVIHLAQDPGQAGKDQAEQLRKLLSGFTVKSEPVTGRKGVRARPWADQVNSGNAVLIDADWNRAFIEEHRKFREDEEHEFDDQVDASSDSHTELSPRRTVELKFY